MERQNEAIEIELQKVHYEMPVPRDWLMMYEKTAQNYSTIQ